MNAPIPPNYFHAEVKGELLYSGWQHTDHLQLDLYGSRPTEDGGYEVTGVTVHGHNINIVELFSAVQLEYMGEYLTFKDDVRPTLQAYADKAKHEAMRPPYERNRAAY